LKCDIKAATTQMEDAMNHHRSELLAANERHTKMVEEFDAQQQWVRGYIRSKEVPELSEVIELEVGGTPVVTTRRVLTLCPESTLAQRFAAGLDEGTDGDGESGSGDSSSDEEAEDRTTVIEEDPQAFLKMLDRLRMRAVLGSDELMPPPTIVADKRDAFVKVLSVYFPAQESFIMERVGQGKETTCTTRPKEGLKLTSLRATVPRRVTPIFEVPNTGFNVTEDGRIVCPNGPVLLRSTEGIVDLTVVVTCNSSWMIGLFPNEVGDLRSVINNKSSLLVNGGASATSHQAISGLHGKTVRVWLSDDASELRFSADGTMVKQFSVPKELRGGERARLGLVGWYNTTVEPKCAFG
jgi:hypothetical protein